MTGEQTRQHPEHWQLHWLSQANRLNLALRNFLSWTPLCYREKPAGQLDLSGFPPEDIARAEALLAQFGLNDLPARASQQRCLETLTYLDWLEQMAETQPDWFKALSPHSHSIPEHGEASNRANPEPPLSWLDVGAKNWAYVEALAGFARARLGGNVQLNGVEVDPHRRYTNLQTRGQAAKAFIETMPQAQYHAGDILDWQKPAHMISMFLPFVFEEPHLAWGLPLTYFQPQKILNHALQLLAPGGVLIVVNQGEVEAEAQAQLFQAAQLNGLQLINPMDLEIKKPEQLNSRFIDYQYPRFGWMCRKA